LKHPSFLKFIYKNCPKIFSEFLVYLSTNDEIFTKQSSIEITKYIDDISFYDDGDLYKLLQAIIPVLAINDQYQMLRFNILIGYPQVIVEEPNSRSNLPYFGYHNMSEYSSKVYEMKGMINIRNTCCLMKKILSLKSREKAPIENHLLLLEACITNKPLLKYLRNMPSEEPYYEDFIQWGVTIINHYTSKYDNPVYLNALKAVVEKINQSLGTVLSDPNILKNHKGFVGKFLHKDIKREEFSLVYKNDGFFIIQCNYYTNVLTFNSTKEIDYSKSRSYYGASMYEDEKINEKNETEDIENNLVTNDNVIVIDLTDKPNLEREWFRKIIPTLSQGKKIVVQNKNKVENATFNLIRFVAFNSIIIFL
jgi:hypothetical protein